MKETAIEKLSNEQSEYAAPRIVAENAQLKDARAEYERWKNAPDDFWNAEAGKFVWTKKWNQVSKFDGCYHEWFVGGKTNITLNALDRHVNSERRNVAAFIWLGEDGSEKIVTYDQLLRSVNRFANGLKSLGVTKGDRVVIYMPLTIEGTISMLACARIGAIHSVVYAGLGHAALRDRIVDAQAKVVITGDVGFRRGKAVPLKTITDEAVADLEFVEKIVVFSRRLPKIEFVSSREIDFDDLMNFPDKCEAEIMDAEDILFILTHRERPGNRKA